MLVVRRCTASSGPKGVRSSPKTECLRFVLQACSSDNFTRVSTLAWSALSFSIGVAVFTVVALWPVRKSRK